MSDNNISKYSKHLNSPFTIHNSQSSKGFTLVEVLVTVSILAIVMSIIYSAFTTSTKHAAIVEEKADEIASIVGALDTMSREIRAAYLHPEGTKRNFSGKSSFINFVTTAPYIRDGEPNVQRISYIFEDGNLKRKTFNMDTGTESQEEFLFLKGTESAAFSFYDSSKWVDEWNSDIKLPYGVRVVFSYRGRDIENIMPVWSRM